MSLEITLMFTVLLLTVVLFMFEVFPMDIIAFFITVLLILLDFVTPEQGINGLSTSASIAVLAIMTCAIATEENVVLSSLSSGMSKVRSLPVFGMAPILMFAAAGISAFISNTAVVIVCLKMINQLS